MCIFTLLASWCSHKVNVFKYTPVDTAQVTTNWNRNINTCNLTQTLKSVWESSMMPRTDRNVCAFNRVELVQSALKRRACAARASPSPLHNKLPSRLS